MGGRTESPAAVDIAEHDKYPLSMTRLAMALPPRPLTAANPGGKLRAMKRRVLLEPAVASPKRAQIQAAVEKVVADRKRREAEGRALARKAHRSQSA